MRFQTLGPKSAFGTAQIKNAHGSSIPAGSPVVLKLNGTDDGLAVILPSGGSAAQNSAFFHGVATDIIADGALGEAVTYGYCRNVVLCRQTRAASTDTWASEASIATGVVLTIASAQNAFTQTVSTQASNVVITLNAVQLRVAESLASYASSASATSDTRLAITTNAKAVIRMM